MDYCGDDRTHELEERPELVARAAPRRAGSVPAVAHIHINEFVLWMIVVAGLAWLS